MHVISKTLTQGRFGNGRGQEYAEAYKIQYWRPGMVNFIDYRDSLGRMVSDKWRHQIFTNNLECKSQMPKFHISRIFWIWSNFISGFMISIGKKDWVNVKTQTWTFDTNVFLSWRQFEKIDFVFFQSQTEKCFLKKFLQICITFHFFRYDKLSLLLF